MANVIQTPLIVGYTSEPRADAREGILPCTKYAKADTNATHDKELQANEHQIKLLGHITRIVAVDLLKREMLDTNQTTMQTDPKKDGARNPAHAFAAWLLGHYSAYLNSSIRGSNDLVCFGFNLKPMFRILGPECNVDANFRLPMGLWFANDDLWDPCEMMVESDYREQIPLAKALQRVGLRGKVGYAANKDAMADSWLAAELVLRYKLIPVERDKELVAWLKAHLDAAANPTEEIEPPVTDTGIPAKKADKKPKKLKA